MSDQTDLIEWLESVMARPATGVLASRFAEAMSAKWSLIDPEKPVRAESLRWLTELSRGIDGDAAKAAQLLREFAGREVVGDRLPLPSNKLTGR